MSGVERQAENLVNTSVQDAISGAWAVSVAVCKRAIQLEQRRKSPRVALIRGLQTEIRKKERQGLRSPRDAA